MNTVGYNYRMTYNGKKKYKDKEIVGMSIDVAIIACDKEGHPIEIAEEHRVPCLFHLGSKECRKNIRPARIIKVRRDNKKGFIITKNEEAEAAFCKEYGWDHVNFNISGYFFDVREKEQPIEYHHPVSKREFFSILMSDTDNNDVKYAINSEASGYRIWQI